MKVAYCVLKVNLIRRCMNTFKLFHAYQRRRTGRMPKELQLQILATSRPAPTCHGSELEDFGKLKATVIFCIASGWAIIGLFRAASTGRAGTSHLSRHTLKDFLHAWSRHFDTERTGILQRMPLKMRCTSTPS